MYPTVQQQWKDFKSMPFWNKTSTACNASYLKEHSIVFYSEYKLKLKYKRLYSSTKIRKKEKIKCFDWTGCHKGSHRKGGTQVAFSAEGKLIRSLLSFKNLQLTATQIRARDQCFLEFKKQTHRKGNGWKEAVQSSLLLLYTN